MARTYTFWTVEQVAEFLGTSLNNVRQITFRHKHGGVGFGVHHIAGGLAYYDSADVKAYALVRRGRTAVAGSARKTRDRRASRKFDR